jgi:hypothetical protein
MGKPSRRRPIRSASVPDRHTLPLRSPSSHRILDPFLDHIKVKVADPADYFRQDLLALVLDPGGEITTRSMVVLGHLDQAGYWLPLFPPAAPLRTMWACVY